LRADTTAPLHRVTEITLFRDSDRIEIRNSILENFSDVRTWAFSFNLQSPDVWHEEVGAINHARIEPEGNYAARFSRLDWLTLNHFAAMSGTDGVGITLSNTDDAFMKLGHSDIADGVSHLDIATPQISVLAGGQVDGASLGIAGQDGDSNFLQRFALQAYAHYDAASSMRFALEAQNPLVTGVVTGGAEYPERSFSLLSSSDADVMLWALKPAEDGIEKGVIARFWNLAGHEGSVSVDLQGGLSAAESGTHLETDFVKARVDAGELRAKIAPWQIKTFRLLPISSQPRDSANSNSGSGQ
jgi:alpha-mannosidase